MSEKKLRRLPLAAAALVACVSAQAEYQSPDGNFRLSGFGTIGAVRNGTDDAEFNYPGQGGGATKRGSLNPDSKLAVQGTYKFSPTVSGTTQVMTKYDADGQYVPGIEWAFAKWQATPGLSFRAGRMGAPYFMISDFRDVGYANTTVRPALDVYGQVPVSQFQGADASYQLNVGQSTVTATLWAGDSKAYFNSASTKPPTEVLIQGQIGLNLQADLSEGWSMRLGRSQGKLTLNSASGDLLRAYSTGQSRPGDSVALQTAAAQGAGVRAILAGAAAGSVPTAAASLASLSQVDALVNPSGVNASFTGFGLTYDQDNWVFNGEYTKRKTDSFVSDTTGWYGTLGYRISKFTPYFGLSKVVTNRRSSNPVVASNLVGTLGGGNANAVAADFVTGNVKAGVDSVLGVEKLDQKTTTLGVRWDATSSLAVKAQFDRIVKPADSNGMFLIPDSTTSAARNFTNNKRSVNVLTLSVDFVF
ncbi:MAG: hypothetical protein EKK47_00535 [Burkholderiales bacterium]|nr:MAG: hypothetical protein EKK47_00535 [Burkholderiales bacterium]